MDTLISDSIQAIVKRIAPGGGFSQRRSGEFRTDATAWGVLALMASNRKIEAAYEAASRLASVQSEDGRLSVAEDFGTAYWPTSLSVLAWKKNGSYPDQKKRAVKFLLGSSGLHFTKENSSPAGHDTSLRGWPWIENTHSWVEPTVLSILALRATGNGQHERVKEAMRMILDRRLAAGGWNYGNTTVFDRELLPMPEHTGQALCALSGYVQAPEVQKSIDWAKEHLPTLRTPLSLCWCLFGLSAWAANDSNARARVLKCLSLQEKFGPYDTTLLAQLIVAYETNGDFLRFLGI